MMKSVLGAKEGRKTLVFAVIQLIIQELPLPLITVC